MRLPQLRTSAAPGAAIFVAGLLAGSATMWFFGPRVSGAPEPIDAPREMRQGGFRLINPLLECDVAASSVEQKELARFEDRIEELVEELIESGKAHHVGVYFRDLNNGPWFGIDEKEPFAPASLLKLPVLIAYLRLADDDPAILGRSYPMTARALEGPVHGTPEHQRLVVGRSYTVKELLRQMIVFSDNQAVNLLIRDFQQHFARPFIDLQMPVPQPDRPEASMTVRTYASFFRILFNASYLSNEMSEAALQLLSQSEFSHGLVAGVPAGVTVAHKYGQRVLHPTGPKAEEQHVQFHDCGIVYYPQRPYLLCVMTSGDDSAELIGSIRDVSREVYRAVDEQRSR